MLYNHQNMFNHALPEAYPSSENPFPAAAALVAPPLITTMITVTTAPTAAATPKAIPVAAAGVKT